MVRSRASNDFEQIVLDNIKRCGWHSTSVGPTHGHCWFAYTVGLFESYGHAELLAFGRSPKDSHKIFTAAVREITRGRPLARDCVYRTLVPKSPCVLVRVPKRFYADFVLAACWYYNGTKFPLYQVVWPCKNGYFPWHPDASEALREVQPVLGQPAMTV